MPWIVERKPQEGAVVVVGETRIVIRNVGRGRARWSVDAPRAVRVWREECEGVQGEDWEGLMTREGGHDDDAV